VKEQSSWSTECRRWKIGRRSREGDIMSMIVFIDQRRIPQDRHISVDQESRTCWRDIYYRNMSSDRRDRRGNSLRRGNIYIIYYIYFSLPVHIMKLKSKYCPDEQGRQSGGGLGYNKILVLLSVLLLLLLHISHLPGNPSSHDKHWGSQDWHFCRDFIQVEPFSQLSHRGGLSVRLASWEHCRQTSSLSRHLSHWGAHCEMLTQWVELSLSPSAHTHPPVAVERE
jgi:hypothetical protein